MCSNAFTSNSSCSTGDCTYFYGYGSGNNTFTRGVFSTETFTFEGSVSNSNLTFGCGFDNEGNLGANPGIVGLGRGNLSLVSQMKAPKFSYCLPSFDSNETGLLSVGGSLRAAKASTPLLNNPFIPTYYYLSLHGITIGQTPLNIDKSKLELNRIDGTGGFIIDSGSTLTYLEKSAFDQVAKELTKQLKLRSFDASATYISLELCYNITRPLEEMVLPNITFHFKGGADFEVMPDNYFTIVDHNQTVGCLTMGSSPFSDGTSIFGNYQQHNALVGYDLVKNKLSFITNTDCAAAN